MIFLQIPVGSYMNFSYLIGDEQSREAAVIDPAWEVGKLIKSATERNLRIRYVINTHSHFDHVGGNEELVSKTGAKVIAHEASPIRKDASVRDGEIIEIGSLKVRVMHTPGHCPDSICLIVQGKLITGDTLFVGECGRTDLAGGNSSELYDSLFNKILKLDDTVQVYPGHDYGDRPYSTVGHERMNNYTLKPRTREEFVRFMKEP